MLLVWSLCVDQGWIKYTAPADGGCRGAGVTACFVWCKHTGCVEDEDDCESMSRGLSCNSPEMMQRTSRARMSRYVSSVETEK